MGTAARRRLTVNPPTSAMFRTRELATPAGPARVHLSKVRGASCCLLLGHGAGGGVGAPDLVVAQEAALKREVTVALVEQPYRVAGRRSPPPASRLDEAWTAVIGALRDDELDGMRLICGGRSSGARVACRTADATGAAAILCLAFPLQPPRRRRDGTEPPSRQPELDAVAVPALVVQGSRDRFGVPPAREGLTVVTLDGDHGLKADLPGVERAVSQWLETVRGDRGPDRKKSGRRESNPP